MPKLNKNLLRSMNWDLEELCKVTGEVISWAGEVDCHSWRYPDQRSDSIDANAILRQNIGLSAEQYFLLLELIYDRFHFLVHVLIKFLEMVPVLSGQFKPLRHVTQPRHISLGALVNMFWDRLLSLYKSILRTMIKNSNMTNNAREADETSDESFEALKSGLRKDIISMDSLSRSVQTDACSLLSCCSCSMTETTLKSIVRVLESDLKLFSLPSATSEEREKLKANANKITQWCAAADIGCAIVDDVHRLVGKVEEDKREIAQLRCDMKANADALRKEEAGFTSKIRASESKINSLRVEVKKEKEGHAATYKQIEQLQKKVSKKEAELKKVNEKLADAEKLQEALTNNLSKVSKDLERTSRDLKETELALGAAKKEKEILENRSSALELNNSSLENEAKRLQRDLRDAEESCRSLELNRRELEKRLIEGESSLKEKENLKNEMLKWNKHVSELEGMKTVLEEKVKALECQNCSMWTTVSKLEKENAEYRERETALIQYPDLNGPIQVQTKGKGDVMEDMQGQIRANELRIRLLQEQNSKLEATVGKLKTISQKKVHIR